MFNLKSRFVSSTGNGFLLSGVSLGEIDGSEIFEVMLFPIYNDTVDYSEERAARRFYNPVSAAEWFAEVYCKAMRGAYDKPTILMIKT